MLESLRAAPLVAAALMAADPAGAGNPVTGIWVADLDSQQGLPTDVYLVRDGAYSCEAALRRAAIRRTAGFARLPGAPAFRRR